MRGRLVETVPADDEFSLQEDDEDLSKALQTIQEQAEDAQILAPQFKKDVIVLECIQSMATKLVKGLEGMSYGARQRALDLSSLEQRRLWGDLIALYSFLRRECGEGGALWYPVLGHLHQGRFRLDMRKHFFTVRVVKHWNRLPREVVDAPSLLVIGHECQRKKGLEGPTQKALQEARQQKTVDAESSSSDPVKDAEKTTGKRYPKAGPFAAAVHSHDSGPREPAAFTRYRHSPGLP
ncbi:hypothetical protein QYF61_005258 [Mycteria americana]|uniref:Uncharacterized protein n=1 Tax=Mycteria americana TaxID=33587 RepID=A0AAN7NSL1_MYCAM|nr:hypothetical protein QYF61_005258 [Mycteria americana]